MTSEEAAGRRPGTGARLRGAARWISRAAAIAGLGVVVWLLADTDVLGALATLPPALLLLVPAFAPNAAMGTLSWALAFPREPGSSRPPFRTLFTIRLAGEAVNNALASAYVAGEPVKGLLATRHGTRPAVGLASALTGKTTNVLGEVLFLFVGVGVAASLLGGDARLVSLLLAVAGGGLLVVLVGIVVQHRRVVGRGARLLRLLRLGPRRLWDRALPGADAIDAAVARWYRDQRGDVLGSTLWALGGWLIGAAEVCVFLAVATPVEDPVALGVVIEAGIAVVKGLSFFVPASLGAQEGGIVWLFATTGAGRELGLAYAIFRRFRELVWIGLGFWALGWHLRAGASPPMGDRAPAEAHGPPPAAGTREADA